MNHTPGPWLIHDKSTLHMNDAEIASVGQYLRIVTHKGGPTNPRLDAEIICMAPELLQVCLDLCAADTVDGMRAAFASMQAILERLAKR